MTTPVRDLDVYLEGGPPDADLAPLWALLDADRAAAQAALISALDSERYRQFGALVTRVTRPREVPPPGPSTGRWAAKAVRKAHRALIRQGREAADATELHEVRKAGKRLRYLLDAFSPVFAADATAAVIKDLKALQNVLGSMQDGAVHADMLAAAGDRLDGVPTSTLIALGRLVEVEHQRQRKAANGFAERFERFAADGDRVDAALAPLERA
jgi:CHAD domain-containing protein